MCDAKMLTGLFAALLALSACTPSGDSGSGDEGSEDGSTDEGNDEDGEDLPRREAIAGLTGSVAAGGAVYTRPASDCSSCHGGDGTGLASTAGGPVVGKTKTQVIDAVLDPPDGMTNFSGGLSDQQIADVAAYIESL